MVLFSLDSRSPTCRFRKVKMAKFFGPVGYKTTIETVPVVWSETILERMYYGDVVRNSIKLQAANKVNSDLSVGNSISIVSDAYALNNFTTILYVKWLEAYWTVADVSVDPPRLILRLGELYNGDTPPAADPP